MKKKLWIVPVVLTLLSVVGVMVVHFFELRDDLIRYSGVIQGYVEAASFWGPVMFTLLFTLAILLVLPTWPIIILGGVIFGLPWGIIYVLLGDIIGGYLTFTISRHLEGGVVGQIIHRRSKKYYKYYRFLDRHGISTVIFLHFTFLIPFSGVSYLLGLTKVSTRDYLIGATIGAFPGAFFYTYLGYAFVDFRLVNFVIVAVVLVIILLIGGLAYKNIFLAKK